MAWIETTFSYGSILTSSKMTNLYNNFAALAAQESGAPTLWSNGMYGFDMDGVSDINSPVYVHAMKVGPGICRDASKVAMLVFDGEHTKEISSGANYSFGNSGGAVPSLISSNWAVSGVHSSYQWYHMILMKNTISGSMDWGIDTNPYSATTLMTEVNSVNGGGWDQFRRLGSILSYHPHGLVDFHKRGNVFQRNSGLAMTASVSAITSWFDFLKIGPTGTECLVNLEFKSADRAVKDYVYVAPYGVHSYNEIYGLYGVGNSFRFNGQSVTMMVNSGNCQCRVASTVLSANFIVNWWMDPFTL